MVRDFDVAQNGKNVIRVSDDVAAVDPASVTLTQRVCNRHPDSLSSNLIDCRLELSKIGLVLPREVKLIGDA